jgi:hypothetical protein
LLLTDIRGQARNDLLNREYHIFEEHLPELVPPELLALNRGRGSFQLMFRDGFLGGLNMEPYDLTSLTRLGNHLPATVDSLTLRLPYGYDSITADQFLACDWLSQIRALTFSQFFAGHNSLLQGDWVRILRSDRLRNLQHLEFDPFTPEVFADLFHARGVVSPSIRSLTLGRELSRGVLMESGIGSTSAPEFSSFDWTLFVPGLRTRFPQLTQMRISRHTLSAGEQQTLVGQAQQIGLNLEFLD